MIWSTRAYVRKEDVENYEKMMDLSKWEDGIQNNALKIYGSSLSSLWEKVIHDDIKILNEGGNICMGELSKIKCRT